MQHFDLCVIGSGQAGFAAAMRALDFDKTVCLIERKSPGGAGIRNGALSSKTLWELSVRYERAICNRYGYNTYGADLSYSAVIGEMRKAVNQKVCSIEEPNRLFCSLRKANLYRG